jgi:hypothetical protein
VVGYADLPASECSKPVKLQPYSTYQPRQLPPAQPVDRGSAAEATTSGNYKSMEIVQPAPEGTVRSNEGKVAVAINLEPALQEGHRVTLYIDGRAVPGSFDGLGIDLSGVERGTHKLRAEIKDQRGRRLIESSTVSFTLRKVSVLDAAEPEQPIEPGPGEPENPDLNPEQLPQTGGVQKFDPQPSPIPVTPGKTNPAFAPNYNP